MDNRLHNDCDGGQCWACAQDKLDTMTKYAGAEVDRNASLRTRAEIAETAYERCVEDRATLEARVAALEADKARLVAALEFYASEWGWWTEDESADGGAGYAPSEALCEDAGRRARAELTTTGGEDDG